ncbi:hypothetical protein [Corynebacterium lowii]|uniref:Uncharacterized protein n=1 Tax=Corynebacterium lowii TaxID=1544413 RepID=A0A0Q1E230_9CORY|nr:hypothetical protein [Corynebacterium lowii]KQB86598.1 hypothetical protein Clow_00806 [Corynebacterium lowii]MDP9851282.1 hypothetical protein [Corynebacterium lowii]
MSDLQFEYVTEEGLRERRRLLEAQLDVSAYLGIEGPGLSYRNLHYLADMGVLTEADRDIYDELVGIEFLLGER